MKQCYKINRYVTVSPCEDSAVAPFDAEMRPKIPLGRPLILNGYPCRSDRVPVDLGTVLEVRSYKKSERIEIRTGQGWFQYRPTTASPGSTTTPSPVARRSSLTVIRSSGFGG